MLKYTSCSNDTKGRFCLRAVARDDFFARAMIFSLESQSRLAIPRRFIGRSISLFQLEYQCLSAGLVANRQLSPLMSRLFDLVCQSNSVVLKRNPALTLLIGNQVRRSEAEFAGALTWFEKSSRA